MGILARIARDKPQVAVCFVDRLEEHARILERFPEAGTSRPDLYPDIRVLSYIEAAGIAEDTQGPLFRPMTKDGLRLERRHMDRKTPWRLVKHYCRAAGIDPDRIDGRGIGIHSLRKTAINDAIRNGAGMHEVREFAGHSDIRTTELYFVRKEEDAEMAARRIQIRLPVRK